MKINFLRKAENVLKRLETVSQNSFLIFRMVQVFSEKTGIKKEESRNESRREFEAII